jgi:hypothetical protein
MTDRWNSFDEYGFYGENNGPLADPRDVQQEVRDIFDMCEKHCEPIMYDGLCEDCLFDIVDQPQHYARWKIQPITYIMRNGMEFWRGNIIKYASRAGFKIYDGMDQEDSEIKDLEKVIRYCEMRINQINGETEL